MIYFHIVVQVSSFATPALRGACARMSNAAVAVLGPELTPGSQAFCRARSLVVGAYPPGSGDPVQAPQPLAQAQAWAALRPGVWGGDDDEGGGDEDGAGSGLQAALFTQQMTLFAPHAMPAAKHVPMLQVSAT
jgi:hypothetical protein